ncbi:PREDICTED: dickkopf-related protein 1-like [Cyprinodon variegatus]|uniref:dickkopf-related protein 1-like n=1 Tax=Cyprinodon variegatus TaxID=28743 RepID=UPI0007426DF8|nr:PREDICTED: dickkopf-related protein 1-like [Cyprinodon variegatus]
MWIYRSLLCVSLAWGLALDSNTIRSSKETSLQSSEQPMRGSCSNRPDRRNSNSNRQMERQHLKDRITHSFNGTKGPEMSSCVRSGDCAAGLCCVRYLTGKRCQRIPLEGEACLLRGASKLRRNLGRCDCSAGLSCAAVGGAGQGKNKRQGVCVVRSGQAQRKTRHSGKKKKRTAERSC